METVQQNGRFTLFSSKFPSNVYSILFGWDTFLIKKMLEYQLLIEKSQKQT